MDYGSFFASRLCLRVRHYRTPRDYRSIQSDDVARIAPVIVRFIRWGVFTGVIALEDEIVIVGYSDNVRLEYPFQRGGASALLRGSDE